MTKQNINVGSGELSGDGESIRAAFVKINENFDEVYSATPVIPTNISAFNNDVGYITTSSEGHPKNTLSSGTVELVYTDNNMLTVPGDFKLSSQGDINLESFSTNSVNVFAEFHVHSASAPLTDPILRVLDSGSIRMLVPSADNLSAAVMIIGSTTTNFVAPQNTGVLLHLTGQQTNPSRIYNDGDGSYAAYVGRRYDGTSSNPQAVTTTSGSAGLISRVGATPYVGAVTNGGWPQLTTSRIEFRATEDQTSTRQGNQLEFWTTPIGTSIIHQDISISSRGIGFRNGSYQDTAAIPLTEKGVAYGVATLGADSRVTPNQLPAGAIFYKGAWDAGTNTPFLYASSGTYVVGWEYSVSSTGTQSIDGGGPIDFFPGDYIIYNGTGWDRIPGNNGVVITFNSRTGDVVMNTTDVTSVLTTGSVNVNALNTPYVTINPGAGLSGGGRVNLGATVNINNIGVTSIIAGTNITVSANTGSVTIGTSIPIGYTGSRGTDGVVGYNGSVGYTGSRGNTGTGYTGSAGTVGSIGNTGYTGSAGTNGSQGNQGLTGFVGSAGTNGTNGFTGSAGANGIQGNTGFTGSVGNTGTTGSTGFTGSKGDQGSIGNTGYTGSLGGLGYTGSQGVGYTGSQGVGYTGSQGNIGYTGSAGTNGTNGATGFTGSQGTTGTTGATGYTGSVGTNGATGFTGSRGTTGTTGATGYTGSQGIQGLTGDTGYIGSRGVIGYTGSQGVGYTGSQGVGYTGSLGGTGYTGSQGVGYTGSQGVGYTGSLGGTGYTGSKGVADVYVSSISTGTGIFVTTSTGAVTVSLNTATVMNQSVNLSAMTSILTGAVSIDVGNIAKASALVGTAAITGLTTSHKILMLPSAGMVDGVLVGGAVCLSNGTVSVTMQNPTSAAINPPAYTITYLAWI
jgi:hypothetical protein